MSNEDIDHTLNFFLNLCYPAPDKHIFFQTIRSTAKFNQGPYSGKEDIISFTIALIILRDNIENLRIGS